jgi:hypothetical protein
MFICVVLSKNNLQRVLTKKRCWNNRKKKLYFHATGWTIKAHKRNKRKREGDYSLTALAAILCWTFSSSWVARIFWKLIERVLGSLLSKSPLMRTPHFSIVLLLLLQERFERILSCNRSLNCFIFDEDSANSFFATSQATPRPAASMVDSVPARWPFSCPAPCMCVCVFVFHFFNSNPKHNTYAPERERGVLS